MSKPRFLCWTLSYWDEPNHPAQRFEDGIFSLSNWRRRMLELFNPVDFFIASGTWSDPKDSPIQATVVNAGCRNDGVYYGRIRHYGKCAFTAAMAYALNRDDWDYLVTMDTDGLIGDVHFPELFSAFERSPAVVMAPSWCGYVGGPFMAWKREGASRLLHRRITKNLYNDEHDVPSEMTFEQECFHIYPNGLWWNPWPQHHSMACDHKQLPVIEDNWPFVRQPPEDIAQKYLTEKCPLAVGYNYL